VAACLPACLLVLLLLVVVVVAPQQGTSERASAGDPLPTTRGVVVPSLCDQGPPSARGRSRCPEECVPGGSRGVCTALLTCAEACTPGSLADEARRTRALEGRHKRDCARDCTVRRRAA